MLKMVWRVIKVSIEEWWNDDPFRLASSLAFYTIFSLAPILLISVGLASLIFSQEEARRQVVQQIEMLTGGEGGNIVRQVLENVGGMGGNLKALVGGIIVLVVGSTAVFVNLQSALNDIWKVAAAPGRSMLKSLLRDRLRSFGIVLSVGFLLFVSMLINAFLTGAQEYLAVHVQGISWVWLGINHLLSFTLAWLLFALIYKYLPDVKTAWGDVLMGAFITAALFTGGKHLIGLYLGQVAVGSAFGAAGSFVVLLIWIYYSALIFFYGAEFTQVYARRFGSKIRPQSHAVRVTQQIIQESGREAGTVRKEKKGKTPEKAEKKNENAP